GFGREHIHKHESEDENERIFGTTLSYILSSFTVTSIPIHPISKFDFRRESSRNRNNQYGHNIELEHDEVYNSKNRHSNGYNRDNEIVNGHVLKDDIAEINHDDEDYRHNHLSAFKGGYNKYRFENGEEFDDQEHEFKDG
ncbi:11025_t:CDS:2, partial [Scutellospora calospora]